jgi:hypothetical protein
MTISNPIDTPDWVKDAVFYQIFPDRFARNDEIIKPNNLQPWGAPPQPEGYQGGDLLGVVERLDYLDELGINAIYFTSAAIAFTAGDRISHTLVRDRSYDPYPGIDAAAFGERIQRLLNLYDWEVTQVQLNSLDSHDTARLISIARGDKATLQLATLLQMTYPGAPVVYYGDEIALRGTEAYDKPHQDADARWAFPWHDRDSWDREMLAYFKEVIALRHAHQALRRGHFYQLYAEDGVFAFARRDDVETLVVVLNVMIRKSRKLPALELSLIGKGNGFAEYGRRLPVNDVPQRHQGGGRFTNDIPACAPIRPQICPGAHCIDAKRAAGKQGARQVKILGDQDGRLHLENVTSPVAGVISAAAGKIRLDVVWQHALLDGVSHHGAWLVVIIKLVVATHQDFLDDAHLIQGDGRIDPVT